MRKAIFQLCVLTLLGFGLMGCAGSTGGGEEKIQDLKDKDAELQQELEDAEKDNEELEEELASAAATKAIEGESSASASASDSASASGSASASASEPATAEMTCDVGQECDLGESTITVTRGEKVQNINTSLGNYEGTFVLVEYTYTYGGSSPVDVDEPPFQLSDSDGNTYSINFDATSSYEIDNNRSLIYETIQPGVPREGAAIFQVAPDAEDFTLLVADLIAPQSNKAADVELSGPSASGSGGAEADVVATAENYYEAVDREAWAYTYDNLDSQTRSMFTEQEWSQKNQWFADNEGLELSTMNVVVNSPTSGTEVSVTVDRTFENGTSITRDTLFVMESGSWKHRFTEEEAEIFMPGTPYEEFVSAQ